jgi:hypothetical protein
MAFGPCQWILSVGNHRYGKFRERRAETGILTGDHLPLGDQESIGCNAHGGVVVEASPLSTFEVSKPNLLL